MCTKKQVLIFLAGAEAFHALTHLAFALSKTLPLTFFGITLTKNLNLAALFINTAITAGLLWWASKVKK